MARVSGRSHSNFIQISMRLKLHFPARTLPQPPEHPATAARASANHCTARYRDPSLRPRSVCPTTSVTARASRHDTRHPMSRCRSMRVWTNRPPPAVDVAALLTEFENILSHEDVEDGPLCSVWHLDGAAGSRCDEAADTGNSFSA